MTHASFEQLVEEFSGRDKNGQLKTATSLMALLEESPKLWTSHWEDIIPILSLLPSPDVRLFMSNNLERVLNFLTQTEKSIQPGRLEFEIARLKYFLGKEQSDSQIIKDAIGHCSRSYKAFNNSNRLMDAKRTGSLTTNCIAALADIEGSAEYAHQAVKSFHALRNTLDTESEFGFWLRTTSNLADSLRACGEYGDEPRYLEEAASEYDRIIKLTDRKSVTNATPVPGEIEGIRRTAELNLANVLSIWGRLTNSVAKLYLADQQYQTAQKYRHRQVDKVAWGNCQFNRANLNLRIADFTGDPARIDLSISLLEELAGIYEPNSTILMNVQMTLGNCYIRAFNTLHRQEDAEQAQKIYEELLRYIEQLELSKFSFDVLYNYSAFLITLGRFTHDESLLRKAISLLSSVPWKKETPLRQGPSFGKACLLIGKSFLALGKQNTSVAELEQALCHFSEAVTEAERLQNTGSQADGLIERARAQFEIAIVLQRSDLLGAAKEDALNAWRIHFAQNNEHATLTTGTMLVEILCRLQLGDKSSALTYVESCLKLSDKAIADASRSAAGWLEAVDQVSALHGMKAVSLLRLSPKHQPSSGLFAILRRTSRTQDRRSDHIWQAALAAEAGRARIARDAISAEMPEGVTTPKVLAAAAPKNGALVLPVITASESLVFVIRRDSPPAVVKLPSLTIDMLQARFTGEDGWFNAQRAVSVAGRGLPHGGPAINDWNAHLNAQAVWLHANLFAQLEDRFVSLGLRPANGDHPGDPIVLLPTGLMGLLPLGAARSAPDSPSLSERWSLTLAPSAAMLAACRSRAGNHDARSCTLLGLFDPAGDLPGAAKEAKFVEAHLTSLPKERLRLLIGREATRETALAEAAAASHLILSCHGVHDAIVPDRSGLQLFDDGPLTPLGKVPPGRLTLADLRDLQLSARLIQMNACESGVAGVRKAPDEFVGLPSGVLAAGAAAAIGTLWEVPDNTAEAFTRLFISAHLNPDGSERLPPAEAFRNTQRKLRHITVDELRADEPLFRPNETGTASETGTIKRKGLSGTVIRETSPEVSGFDQPFKDLHDWAAFTYHGA